MNKIATLRQKRGLAIEKMDANSAWSTPEEKAAYEAAAGEVADIEAQIKRLEELQRMKGQSAAPVEVNAAGAEAPKREKGIAVARCIRALAAAKGDPRRAAEYAEQVIRDGEVAKALAAGSSAAGGALVPEAYTAEIIENLTAKAVVRRMGARSVPLPNGNMTWPKLTGSTTAQYIGENTNVPKTETTFGQLKLSAKKLAALVPISNDLIRFGNPQADTIVRDDLVNSMALAEDLNFIRGDGTGNGPKGLRYWAPAASVIAVNATVNLINITQDLGKLELALMEANSPMITPGWIFAPRTKVYLENLRDGNGNIAFPEMARGQLKGYPFTTTTQIPVNLAVTDTAESEIYFVDFSEALIGDVPGLVIEVSSEAAYYDGASVVSAFSLDQTVIKVIAQHDFGMRHAASVAVLKDVDWK
jgi:HK97 family phage major capsid protein